MSLLSTYQKILSTDRKKEKCIKSGKLYMNKPLCLVYVSGDFGAGEKTHLEKTESLLKSTDTNR